MTKCQTCAEAKEKNEKEYFDNIDWIEVNDLDIYLHYKKDILDILGKNVCEIPMKNKKDLNKFLKKCLKYIDKSKIKKND